MAEDNEDGQPREDVDPVDPADVASDDIPHDEATAADTDAADADTADTDTDTDTAEGAEAADSADVADEPEAEAETPFLEAVPGGRDSSTGSDDWSRLEEPAKEFFSSLESILGGMFKDASEAMDRMARRASGPRPVDDRDEPADRRADQGDRRADPTEFIDSVESWLGEFFRGDPVGKAAAGFGKAAAGSAFKQATKNNDDDVWASATAAETSGDASRECRYCPFCQTLAAVRNTRPELYEQIGDTAKTLVDLVRQAAEQSKNHWPRR